jgi:YHS domain-containing protein
MISIGRKMTMKTNPLALLLTCALLLGCDKNTTPLQSIDPAYVCMPQNKVFDRKMLSVNIAGKTYYGCCENCIDLLQNETEKYAYAIDPVTGEKIDKAKAFILEMKGNALYFATEENARKFAEKYGLM